MSPTLISTSPLTDREIARYPLSSDEDVRRAVASARADASWWESLGHAERPCTPAPCQRWLSLFHETLELGWTEPRADRAAALADNVARVHSQHLIGEPVTVTAARRTS